ncbi:hypothetical protein METBIDRAFT_203238 [Metschnikowia bicuspidata var. bicuspidata NRRL YB-4993]|uniref:Uncharacterized protein n=1 Tax=Metschnikowia bicuspidata var. bicuspidata NRRL YB-4993 TaxID=869754 RepID=A0A1A0H9Z3_9ASCO|nr:hypothetical protein METBIDRAFT_203192 [Metschnikowia bicuspidata var. bicuspidata NRRL YB-4993]XP_018711219.1 hypothetical protein METBIDRAFT_203238 [Metschnikowia bicuspidata var. bicuspidata NRRL YB-4993]OBA20693.1 hypothetical protein METBIDRAFT_203192 [Metschnikowia bicuspidata var. bicuspidata NRRL YB-4993]OBA20697.1 hypothetical protein METBIDRAFT_203238 [Metschnikowia bicuspidata var. bicuspidata NRRL YB-4993]
MATLGPVSNAQPAAFGLAKITIQNIFASSTYRHKKSGVVKAEFVSHESLFGRTKQQLSFRLIGRRPVEHHFVRSYRKFSWAVRLLFHQHARTQKFKFMPSGPETETTI